MRPFVLSYFRLTLANLNQGKKHKGEYVSYLSYLYCSLRLWCLKTCVLCVLSVLFGDSIADICLGVGFCGGACGCPDKSASVSIGCVSL